MSEYIYSVIYNDRRDYEYNDRHSRDYRSNDGI